MADASRLFTASEASVVSGLTLKAVHNAIDKHIVEPVTQDPSAEPRRRRKSRYLTGEDLVRLRLWRGVGETLSAERRHRLFREIAASPEAKTVKADDLLIVDVSEARKQVERGLRDLVEAEAMVHRVKGLMGGAPVFKGTRIPVHDIAAMLEAGERPEELLDGYPSLDRRKLELARIWAGAHPWRGRRPRSLSELGFRLISSSRAPLGPDPLAKHPVAGVAEE